MNIQIKFEPDQIVWSIFNHKAMQVKIVDCLITCKKQKSETRVFANYTLYGYVGEYEEEKLFATKEELIQSL